MKKFLTAALAVTTLVSAVGAGSAASAQSWDGRHRDGDSRYEQRDDRRGDRRADRRDDRADARADRRATRRYNAGRYQRPRGYQARTWRRGERLPSYYRGHGYVMDYRHYGLRAPPYGYQYVRVDNDVYLSAVATGIIASIVFGLFQ